MPGYERDPLSARFDAAAARFVTRVLAGWDGGRNGPWTSTLLAPPSQRFLAWALAQGTDPLRILYTGRGTGIETAAEAAFRKACYFDRRVYLWARPFEVDDRGERVRNPDRVAALEFEWGRRTGGYRVARARAHSVRSASRWAGRNDPYGRKAG